MFPFFKSFLQQIRICNLQAQRDGKDWGERYIADMQSIQQTRPQQLGKDNVT